MALTATLVELTAHLSRRNAPATEGEIAAFVEAIGFQPPADYLELIRKFNGAYGEGSSLVFLYSLAEALERTRETDGLPPRMIVIGSDGGEVQYLLDGRAKRPQIVSLSLHEEAADATRLGATLEKALDKLQKGCQKQEEQFLKRSKLPSLVSLAAGQRGEVARLACGKGEAFAISSMAFAADGSLLALAGDFGVEIWSVPGWQRIAELPLPAEVQTMASDVHLDPSAGEVLSAHNEQILRQDFRRRRVVNLATIGSSTQQRMTVDGQFVVRGLADGSLSVVDTHDGVERQLAPADGHTLGSLYRLGNRILSARFVPAMQQHHLEVWNPGERRSQWSQVLPASLNTAALLDEDRFLRLAYEGIGPQIIHIRTGVVENVALPDLPGASGTSTILAIPGSRRIAMTSYHAVFLLELEAAKLIDTLQFGEGRAPTMLAVSPDGRWLITAGMQSMMLSQFAVRIWNIEGGA